ncbi:MAG: zinc-binding alcohol dehydrogenase family protein [Deltaproteobacteria bacterium]|nr:zinc-binding alcohol dehydrogenase family protein [Deltaproteobacteria bacterium]
MRNVATISGAARPQGSPLDIYQVVELDGVPVTCGLIHSRDTHFDRNDPKNRRNVLVRVKAFSCNYRDKSLIHQVARAGRDGGFYVVGSDFVAEVLEVGDDVTSLRPGDRVIGNGAYPDSGVAGVPGGVPTNHASKELQVFHEAKLIQIPPSIPDPEAAALGIGAQTAYAMVRRLDLPRGANVLVTAAKSNTSLYAIGLLARLGINVYATSTSRRFEDCLIEMGLKELIVVDRGARPLGPPSRIRELVQETGGFDGVIDPFFDLHLERVIGLIRIGGRYITCGWYDQHHEILGWPSLLRQFNGAHVLATAMIRNIQLIGNCGGTTRDLEAAIEDHASGHLRVAVDSVHEGGDVGAFFHRTFNASDRLGKVIYRHA